VEVGRPKEKMDGGRLWLKKLLFLPFISDCVVEKLYNKTVKNVELLEKERKIQLWALVQSSHSLRRKI
jgi:hypothetical protein